MSEFLVLQVIGLIVLLGVLGIIVQHWKKEKNAFIMSVILVIIAMLVIDVFPFEAAKALKSIGFARPLDAFLVMMAGTALLMVIKIYMEQKKIKKDITKMVRNMVLKKEKK